MGLALSIVTLMAAMAQAPVVVKATYSVGRGPCQWLPDGSRRWPLRHHFTVDSVVRGRLAERSLPIEDASGLKTGEAYLVFLRPRPEGGHDVIAIFGP